MKNKRRYVILSGFIFVITLMLVAGIFKKNNGKEYINNVLKQEAYAYLPVEAKDYIKDIYNETGEVILTEKNKEENVPYLNPKYVVYLQLSNKKKKEVSLIPEPYSVDYTFSNESTSEEFPKTYNLENVNGNNYTSPMYNQGGLGTCWAFATIENAESYLMVKKNEPQNDNSTRFSVRQLDYAASTNGIKNYENPWGYQPLGQGGNFVYATTLMANGLSLVDNTYMPYNESLDEKPLNKVHNYNNSLYEVNRTVVLPNFMSVEAEIAKKCAQYMNDDEFDACYDEIDEELKQQFMSIIKEGVINYGGIFVGAYDPTGQCGVINADGSYVLDPNSYCLPMGSDAAVTTGHAMQIIGWDDDYEYSYCKKNHTYSSANDGSCASGVLTQGTGAWLVKNSWGENDAAYIHLTYDSIQTQYVTFSYITSLTEMKDRNWDNVYNNGLIDTTTTTKLTQTFKNKHNNQEKIQKIKFHTVSMDQQYSISVKVGENTYLITDSYQTNYPGLYTVDVSDKDIFIEPGSFDVIISGAKQSIRGNSISVFTKNVNSSQLILTEEVKNIDSNIFTIYSETRNIPSDSEITYELYDNDEKIENVMQVKDNIVSANNVNAEISFIKKVVPGTYKLIQKSGNVEATTTLNIGTILDGAGTVENPYQIYNEEDLKSIHNHLDAHYELANDIELTEEWIPIGTEEMPFTGSFDGKNHKIINLQINDSTLEYAGLFGYVKDSDEHKTHINNIYLINPNVVGKQYVGALIGGININQTGDKTALIDSIYIIGGNIEGEYANGLIADISGYDKLIINNIFSSATIVGSSYSSLIRFSSDEYNSNNGTSISNIENIGVMVDNSLFDYNTSLVNANFGYYYSISNYISTGYSKKIASLNQFYDTPIHSINYWKESNGYALVRSDSVYEFPNNIRKISNITELKNIDKYSDWGEDFNSYWKFDEEDGIKRMPILKGVDLDYTDFVNEISIGIGSSISLDDYVSSDFVTRRLKVTTDNSDVINISEKYNNCEPYPSEIIISPLKSGTAKMHVTSDYDGFEKDIVITVYKDELEITYYNGLDTIKQTASYGSSVNLLKNKFTKEGYEFVGWNTKLDGSGINYTNEQEVTLKEDLDLYAQWQPIKYKIMFYANGGEGAPNEQEIEYDKKTNLNKNTFKRIGYKFKEWNTESDGSGTSYSDEQEILNLLIDDNQVIELYAQWKNTTGKITYNSNYGDNEAKDQSFTFNEDIKLDKNAFVRTGYKFKEWNTKFDGSGTSYSDEQTINESTDMILYAIWESATGKITYNSNYGDNATKDQSFTFNEDIKLDKNTFERAGYKFKEWNTKSDGSGTSYSDEQTINESADLTLYAIWESTTGKITYNSNYGDNETKDQTFTFNEDIKLDKNAFVRTGYKFKEWNTKLDGSGTSYSDEQTINESDNLTLYAIWVESFDYIINTYDVDETNKYISKIMVNTEVNNFTSNIILGYGYGIDVDTKDIEGKQVLYTGGKTRITHGFDLYMEYTNIVIGDINGDGAINSADLLKIRQHLLGTNILSGAYFLASDINYDDTINSADLLRVRQHLLEIKPIE